MKLYDNILFFIAGHRRGWAFSSSDLIQKYERQAIDNIFSDLNKEGKIRRLCRGIYDYPQYSELLKQYLSPDIDQVANAFARKFNWRIVVSGETALNILGLSTQVPGRYIYLSDGPNRSYDILGTTLEFKKSMLKEIGFKYKESALIVQSLNALGKEHITPEIIYKIRQKIDPKIYPKILKDTQRSKIWVHEAIKEICREAE